MAAGGDRRAWRWPTPRRRAPAWPARAIRLKWPNDLVLEDRDGTVRKLAGVLGETVGLGGDDPRAIVGLGLNADWAGGRLPAGARRAR